MFTWSDDMMRYMRTSAEQVGQYTKFAEVASEFFPQESHVIDLGCGQGYLALALSKCVKKVTASDISERALDILRDNIRKTGVENIEIFPCDAQKMPEDMIFDGAVLCFYGSAEESLDFARRHVRGKTVLIKKKWNARRFSGGGEPNERLSFAKNCAWFAEHKIPVETRTLTLEMGQPLKSVEDAVAFFELHRKEGKKMSCSEAEKLLTKTDCEEFPYFLSSVGEVGLIVLDSANIL